MKTLALAVILLLFGGVVSAQAKGDKTPPAVKPAATAPVPTAVKAVVDTPAAVPQLTQDEKQGILVLQRDLARNANAATELEKEKAKLNAQLSDLAGKVSARIGPGFVIDPNTLIVSVDPNAPATQKK